MGSEEIEKVEKKSGLGKKLAQAAFSHLGLCVCVIVYCILGGFLFELLEKENEVQVCIDARREYNEMENETLFSLLDVVMTNPLMSEASDAQLYGVFESFRNNSISIGYDGSWCEGFGKPDGPVHEWTFPGAIFFSMTVMTTIGYGHISPKTIWGRILCISYAMIGIPLMLMFLANIGEVLADIFRYIYAQIICCGCLKERKPKLSDAEKRVRRLGPGFRKPPEMEQEPTNNVRSSTQQEAGKRGIVMSNEPNVDGNNTFRNQAHIVTKDGRVETSLPPNGTVIDAGQPGTGVQRRIPQANPLNIQTFGKSDIAQRSKLIRWKSDEPLISDDDSDDEDDDYEWEEMKKVSVPLTVSLGILALYILSGAILFQYWEEWDLLQSSYFCFITLSTIGFGDVTPGRDFNDPNVHMHLIIGSVYNVFGMAIVSMSFALMQEEMVAKFRWIGRKFGVVDKYDDEEMDNIATTEVSRNQSEC